MMRPLRLKEEAVGRVWSLRLRWWCEEGVGGTVVVGVAFPT